MTQEDKELLLRDLCARLSSMVRVKVDDEYMEGIYVLRGYESGWFVVEGRHYDIDEVTPYLRSMSSMTDEEKREFQEYVFESNEIGDIIVLGAEDWLNTHHFDWRNLIPKNLALVAPEGMYDID